MRNDEQSDSKTPQVSNRFGSFLIKSEKDRPVLDAVLSTGEAVADILTKDDLISAVPFVATAFKVVKSHDSFRDRMFLTRLMLFVRELDSLPVRKRQLLKEKLLGNDEGRKAGESLLLVLEKLTDLDKPALLGMLVCRYAEGRVSSTELRRLACAVDAAFPDDLALLLEESPEQLRKDGSAQYREGLLATGLTRLVVGDTFDTSGEVYFRVTALGELFHSIANSDSNRA